MQNMQPKISMGMGHGLNCKLKAASHLPAAVPAYAGTNVNPGPRRRPQVNRVKPKR